MLMKDLNSKSVDELKSLIEDFKAQLFLLRFKNSTGQLEQTNKISAVRKDIARCFSAINSKTKEIKQSPKKTVAAKTITKKPEVKEGK